MSDKHHGYISLGVYITVVCAAGYYFIIIFAHLGYKHLLQLLLIGFKDISEFLRKHAVKAVLLFKRGVTVFIETAVSAVPGSQCGLRSFYFGNIHRGGSLFFFVLHDIRGNIFVDICTHFLSSCLYLYMILTRIFYLYF